MRAVVGRWKLGAAHVDQQQEVLDERVLPAVKATAGLVAGDWSAPDGTGNTYSFIVFKTAAAGESLAEAVGHTSRTCC